MSNKKDKLGQVIQNFFLKAANVIIQSRSSNELEETAINIRVNKWFNLETFDLPREDLKPWKSTQNTSPIVIETYLDLRGLTIKQSVILKDEQENPWSVNMKKSEIVMERWLIELDPSGSNDVNTELPLLYKKLIIVFRYLYTITKLLPLSKLQKRLTKVNLTKSPLKIGFRVLDGNRPIISKGRIGLSKPIMNTSEDHLTQKIITPVSTTVGTLKISVSYRNHVDFELIDNEETLSSHFQHIDKARNLTSNTLKKAFKAGATSPTSTSPLTRKDSGASIVQALKIQRSGSIGVPNSSFPKSITSSVGSTHAMMFPGSNPTNEQLSSSGSTPKYSSSFLKIQRRSSLRRSSSVEKSGTLTSNDRNTPSSFRTSSMQDADLNDFVKLIEGKQDLKLSYSPNVQDTLGKFQLMKTKNDQLGESMTASMYSKSTSPQPQSNISSISQRSPRPSITGLPPRHASLIQSLRQLSTSPMKRLDHNSSSESLLADQRGTTSQPLTRHSSISPKPRSHRSFSIGPSNPTIAETTTHARMHKASETHDQIGTGKEEEDDDLLFAMSDMNLPK